MKSNHEPFRGYDFWSDLLLRGLRRNKEKLQLLPPYPWQGASRWLGKVCVNVVLLAVALGMTLASRGAQKFSPSAGPQPQLSTSLNGPGNVFLAANAYPSGGIAYPSAQFVTIGDFNGDGKPDFAVANGVQGGTVSVFLGKGDGSFQPEIDTLQLNGVYYATTGDFNGDGKSDLAVITGQNTVLILLSNGDGTFTNKGALPSLTNPQWVVTGDFNGDGKVDVAVVDISSTSVVTAYVFAGNGDGTFNAPTSSTVGTIPGNGSFQAVAADFNKDGHLDLAICKQNLSNVLVLFGNGNGTFQAAISLNLPAAGFGVAAGDFNGDGVPDIVATTPSNGGVSIFLSDGAGHFTAVNNPQTGTLPTTFAAVPNGGATAVAVGDFNKDGKLDVIVGLSGVNGASTVSILLGNGNGTFQPELLFGSSDFPSSVAVADFNGDGDLDWVAVGNQTHNVVVALGRGDGTFLAARNFVAGTTPGYVGMADFNKDGKLDAVVANSGSADISLLLGKGDGTFQPAVSFSVAGLTPIGVVAGDFNGDGNADFVALNGAGGFVAPCYGTSFSCLSIFLGKGDGTFQNPTVISSGLSNATGIRSGDFNGDGKLDLAIFAGSSNPMVSILLGDGDGTFQTPKTFSTGGQYIADAKFADLNKDGKLDLVLTDTLAGQVLIFLGNGDGTFQTPTALTAGTYPGGLLLADFNGDGNLDLLVSNEVSGNAEIWLGNGNGTFNSPSILTTNAPGIAGPRGLLAADFNLDGHLDFAFTHANTNIDPSGTIMGLSLMLGNGDGTFQSPQDYLVSRGALASIGSDLNGDGSPDILLVDSGQNILTVLLNQTPPPIVVSPSSLSFGNQLVGTTSGALTIQVSNNGSTATTIGVTANGDYAQSNNCPVNPATLAAAASCTISVTFKPTVTGPLSGSVTVTDTLPGSPQIVTLSGTGVAPIVTLGGSSIGFGNQIVGTSSAVQMVTLSNTGTAALTISSIAITGTNSGDYSQTNTCGASVAAGANCSISVTFKPTATGSRTASVTITDDASGSPQSVSLTGTGIAPVVGLSPASLTFSSQPVGTTSAAQNLTLSNTGDATLTFSGSGISLTGANSGDFSETNTCGSSVAAGANCTISVTFKPAATGTRTASVSITDDAGNSPQSVSLTGTGVPAAPVVSLSVTSITFGNQLVGTNSSAQSVTLTNTGSATLTFSGTGIAIGGTNSGDFSETNTCGASVAAGANCTIGVTFKPTATGSRSASVSITDNASGSPQSVSLTGTGTAPIVSLGGTSSLSFGNEPVGSTSTAQTITLSNTGTGPLTITSIVVAGTNGGDFAETNTCPTGTATLAVGANCTISVTFKPTATGNRAGSVSITDNAAGSPQSVSLSGTGVEPAVTLSPLSLTFAGQLITTTSAAQSVTLTNSGGAPLTISSITISGANSADFAQTNTCPAPTASLAAGAKCTISVTFKPAASGNRAASVSITDDAMGSPQSVSLTGTGTDFSLAAASGSNCPAGGNCSTAASISAGQTATYALQVSPVSGFNGTVALSCSGAPAPATCAVSPASVPPNGSSSYAFTLTVNNTANATVPPTLDPPSALRRPAIRLISPLITILVVLLMLAGLALVSGRRQRVLVPALAVLLLAIVSLSGCGGGGGSTVKPPTNATITVTGASGGVNHTLPLTLTINH